MILAGIGDINLLANTRNLKQFQVLIWTFYCKSPWRFDREKRETAKHCWERGRSYKNDKKIVVRESRLISREVK